jgi:hypothetical protein
MSRPPLEVADIVRAQSSRFIENNRCWINALHCKVLRAIAHCRTAALGGHRDQCPRCGYRAISYNSCRNRHCPKCQNGARDKWLAARHHELLAVPYVHVVFTLPHKLSQLILQNKKVLYDLLFHASTETLLQVAADPKHLGAQIGFLSVLHTWGQNLLHHPHIHCVIPNGGLSPGHTRWIHPRYPFFLPVGVLRKVFRGKFVAGLKTTFSTRSTHLPRSPEAAGERTSFPRLLADTVSARVGCLCQAALWRAAPRSGISGCLYPSRRHQQPSSLGL